jgi:hypothetical protein
MAEFKDVLNVVFQLTGGAEMARQMLQIAAAAGDMATGIAAVETAVRALVTTMGPLALIILAVAAAIALLKAAVDLVVTSLKAFTEESKKLFATGVVLKNLGSSLTMPEVRRFADQVSRQTGIARPEIEGTAGLLARTGISGGEIEKTLKTIGDAARGAQKPFTEVGEAVEKGILGHMRGLAEFGIMLQDTGSKAANLQLILQQLNLRYQGGAAAFRQTLPGSIEAMSSALQRFLSALGEQFAPAAIRIFNFIAQVLDWLADHAMQVAHVLAFVVGGPIANLLLYAAQKADQGKDPLAKVGMGGDPATEKTLLQVADNTKIMADSVIQQVLGGQGAIVEQSFGYMTARMALAI